MVKVFAIIITHNGIKWIDRCLQSLNLSSIPLSVIVVDNDSKDGTQQFIASNFKEVDFIQLKENEGFGKANNIGIKKAYEAGADYIFLVNQDVSIKADTVELIIKAHFLNPEYGIISPVHLNGNGNALDIGFASYVSSGSCPGFISDSYLFKLKEDIYEIKFVNAAAWLMSRNCVEIVGGFNPLFFLYGEDDNYIHRLHYHGFKIGILASSVIFHDRENRQSNPHYEKEKIQKREILMHYCNPNTDADIVNDIRGYRRSRLKQMASLRLKELQRTNKIIKELRKNANTFSNTLKTIKTKGLSFLN